MVLAEWRDVGVFLAVDAPFTLFVVGVYLLATVFVVPILLVASLFEGEEQDE
jgi:hypothetical protein